MKKEPKISVIMQSYLGEYEGSRKDPIKKFHRAIKSFLENTYKNSEIIIVSDDCQITHEEYHKEYLENKRVKYAFINKPKETLMYSKNGNNNFFRGVPRRIGVSLSDGDLITYLDSDDYLTKNALENIIIHGYNASPESDWWINRSYFDHMLISKIWEKVKENRKVGTEYNRGFDKLFDVLDTSSFEKGVFEFDGLDALFVETKIREGFFSGITSLTTHRRGCLSEWKDTTGISEDFQFGKDLREKHPKGFYFDSPGYVRCHYRGIWDV